MSCKLSRRVIVIDDNRAIHEDFRRIFAKRTRSDELDAAEALFSIVPQSTKPLAPEFQLDFATQGEEGFRKVQESVKGDGRFSVAFVDMRMPPGWDGMQTTEKLWEIDKDLQIVICSAYSDYAWGDILTKFGIVERLFILKKPFDPAEVCQMACALTEKWRLTRDTHPKFTPLQGVADRLPLYHSLPASGGSAHRPPIVRILDDDREMLKSTAWLMDTASLAVRGYESLKEFEAGDDFQAPGCLILDLRLAGEDGIEVLERLSSRPDFHLPVIMLTGNGNIEAAVQCMKLGVIEFLEKPMDSQDLIAKVRAAIAIDIRRCQDHNAIEAARHRVHALSPKERELAILISRGLTSKQIATRLGISIKTVDNRRASAIRKASASNSMELVKLVSLGS